MRIIASRKDDILRRKAQYEADVAAYEERQEVYRRAMHEAEDKLMKPVQDYLERKLARYSALRFDIQLDRSVSGRTNKGIKVWIRCNERNKFDDDVALAWSYDVDLDSHGQVTRKTSSWSGLSATTEAQMTSLRQTVSALEFLNDVDWDELINIEMPQYSDYYDENDKRPAYQNFDAELQAAELADLVGTNKIIKVNNWGESCPYRGSIWLHLTKETPSMYYANIIPAWLVDSLGLVDNANNDSYKPEYLEELNKYMSGKYGEYRVRKTSVKPVSPLEIKEV